MLDSFIAISSYNQVSRRCDFPAKGATLTLLGPGCTLAAKANLVAADVGKCWRAVRGSNQTKILVSMKYEIGDSEQTPSLTLPRKRGED